MIECCNARWDESRLKDCPRCKKPLETGSCAVPCSARHVVECAARVREMFDMSDPNELLVAHGDLADALDSLNADRSEGKET